MNGFTTQLGAVEVARVSVTMLLITTNVFNAHALEDASKSETTAKAL